MRLLLDINIVLDVALRRTPWAGEAAALLSAVEAGETDGHIAAHAVTTYHYVVAKASGRRRAIRATTDLLRLVRVVPADEADFRDALALDLRDFEDAVQVVAAAKIGADYLITRDRAGFRDVVTPVRTAGEILPLLHG